MNRSVVPDNIVRRMNPKDRKSLGLKTSEEAIAVMQVRNELELQKQIVGYLRLRNIEVIWQRTDKRTTTKRGTPDILFAVNSNGFPTPCAWEIKYDRGVPSREQTDMMLRMQTAPNAWRVRLISSFEHAVAELRELNV